MRVCLSEFIDALLGEVGFDEVETIREPSVGDVLMHVEPSGFSEDRRHCFIVEFVVDVGGEKGLDLLLGKEELMRHFLGVL